MFAYETIPTTVEQLKQQLAKDQVQVAQLQLQNTALETMIIVAEKQLNRNQKKVWFQAVQQLDTQYPLAGLGKLCKLFEKLRQAYYEQVWQQDKNRVHQLAILEKVRKIREQLPGIGTNKLHHFLTDFLAEHQIKLDWDKLYALLWEHHLLRTKRRIRAKTTNSRVSFLPVGQLGE